MFTFLPYEHKRRIRLIYRLKLGSIYLGLFTIVFLTGCALMIPSFTLLNARKQAAMLERESATATTNNETGTVENEVKLLKDKIAIIKGSGDDMPILSVIERVVVSRGEGISITNITLKRKTDTGAISIGGVAKSRESLVAFSKRLQGEPSFKNVNLPVASLAKSKDITFNISLDSKF